jgi:histidine triad (HIT) family protein
VVYETEHILAYHHTKPFWEKHVVVIPKRHIESLVTISDEERFILWELYEGVTKVSSEMISKYGGARVLTNLGDYQESKHLHFHINYGNEIKRS